VGGAGCVRAWAGGRGILTPPPPPPPPPLLSYVRDHSELVTGFAASGCHAVLVLSSPPKKGSSRAFAGHPIIPVVHIGIAPADATVDASYAAATDAIATTATAATTALETLAAVAEGRAAPRSNANVFFNITRGPTGVST
jgi:hypothetical protein